MIENYQIEDMLDQTQRWVSYKAYIKDSGRKCLLKRYLIDGSTGLGKVEGWEEEFKLIINELTKIDLPSLRSVIEGGVDPQDGNPYVVFEWFEVSSLSDLLKEGNTLGKDLTEQLSRAALETLSFMHTAGCMHGGLTPETIYFTDSKEKNPWVVDWDPIRSMRCHYQVNRFPMDEYTAPELLQGESASIQSDLYSLGAIAQKSLGQTGEAAALQGWIQKLLRKENAETFQDAAQAQQALLSLDAPPAQPAGAGNRPSLIVGAAPTGASITTPSRPATLTTGVTATAPAVSTKTQKPPPRKKSSNKGPILTITFLALAILGLGSLLLFSGKDSSDEEEPAVVEEELSVIEEPAVMEEPVVQEEPAVIEDPVVAEKPTVEEVSVVETSEEASPEVTPPSVKPINLTAFDAGTLSTSAGKRVQVVGLVQFVSPAKGNVVHIRLKKRNTDKHFLTLLGAEKFKADDIKQLNRLYNKKKVRVQGVMKQTGNRFQVIFDDIQAL